MGNFSFISKNHHEPLTNPWHEKTLCELQLVIGGKVVEKMQGVYSGYGTIKIEEPFSHVVLENGAWTDVSGITAAKKTSCSGELWHSKDWDTIIDYHYSNNDSEGIAAWHIRSLGVVVPESTTCSENDPNQGDVEEETFEDEEEYLDN